MKWESRLRANDALLSALLLNQWTVNWQQKSFNVSINDFEEELVTHTITAVLAIAHAPHRGSLVLIVCHGRGEGGSKLRGVETRGGGVETFPRSGRRGRARMRNTG